MEVMSLQRKSFAVRLVIIYLFIALSQSHMPSSPVLPVRVTVSSPWRSVPLSQSDLGLLFTNSSPFSSTQSLLLIPASGSASKPLLHATFGSYTITQMMSQPVPPLSSSLTASLLSKTVVKEREGDEGNRFKVRVLFHMMGDPNQGTCVTLHAFRQTEEQKASCITQPPFGLCVVALRLPGDWFETNQNIQPNLDQTSHQRHSSKPRSRKRGRWHQYTPKGLRAKSGIPTNKIHLYYSSSFGIGSNFKAGPPVCVEDVLRQSERQMSYIGPVGVEERTETNKTKQSFACLNGHAEEKVWLDSDVLILYSKGPVHAGRQIRVSVNLRDSFDGESLIVRLKVNKGLLSLVVHPVTNSDLWTVSVEKTTSSKHDVISIISHRTGTPLYNTGSSTVQLACLSFEGLHRSFGVAMTVTASWWVEYSGRKTVASMSFFSFIDRDVAGIAPITESNTLINTAILTSQPVSLPVIVLAVGEDGKVFDVTTAVKCHSASEDIVKVSHDCSALYVDGSESGTGSVCAEVEFSLGVFSSSLCLAVWAPVVPLRVSLSDPVLSPIKGWSYHSESGCTPVYQRSTIQILARFSAHSGVQGGQPTYMLGSPDWFVDVTELVRDWLRIENQEIAALDMQKYLVGLKPGITSVYVISSQWDGVLGSADLTVISEPVSPGDLSVQLVGGLGLSINPSPSHPSIVTATVIAHNNLYNHGQEASISVWILFSDDTAVLASAFNGIPYSLRLSSLADSVIAVTPAPSQRILAQGDGGGPLVKAELLVTSCEQVSNHIELEPIQEGSKTRRLAKGSGWIRVNLNMEAWSLESEESNYEMLDVTDMLVDSNKNLYENFEDDQAAVNFTREYDGVMFKENNLEKAVLIPSHEDSAVYFSPGVEKEKKEVKPADRQVEIGVGAVLALLCLSCLLFLINCLPCALKEQWNRGAHERNVHDSVEDEETGGEQEERATEKTVQ